ncbi:hypothetical protein Bbelb_052200 [Branchiostoma belcheri]|nr:hypothetical protein Bbelb_052200 [Branchiostoma belcheri]
MDLWGLIKPDKWLNDQVINALLKIFVDKKNSQTGNNILHVDSHAMTTILNGTYSPGVVEKFAYHILFDGWTMDDIADAHSFRLDLAKIQLTKSDSDLDADSDLGILPDLSRNTRADVIDILLDMGFSLEDATIAEESCDGSVEDAVDWLDANKTSDPANITQEMENFHQFPTPKHKRHAPSHTASCKEEATPWTKSASCKEEATPWTKSASCDEEAMPWTKSASCKEEATPWTKSASCDEEAMPWTKSASCDEEATPWTKSASCDEEATPHPTVPSSIHFKVQNNANNEVPGMPGNNRP